VSITENFPPGHRRYTLSKIFDSELQARTRFGPLDFVGCFSHAVLSEVHRLEATNFGTTAVRN